MLLIVDGHAYAYRAFHAIPRLGSPDGRPTNAIFGFIKMLGKLRQSLSPTAVVVVWDGGLSAERMAVLPQYKAQRPPMPEGLAQQIEEIHAYLDAAGIPSVCQKGVEADDCIASLARKAAAQGMDVVIASSDKDFWQLVTSDEKRAAGEPSGLSAKQAAPAQKQEACHRTGRIGLLNPNDRTETVWTAQKVREKAGVEPRQIVDWLSLVGDNVDNIPGVPGVGPKKAAELLQKFGSVDALYERLEEVKPEKLRESLRAAEPDVRRNQKIIRLKDDLPDENGRGGQWRTASAGNTERLRELFTKWGFRSMLAELEAQPRSQGSLL